LGRYGRHRPFVDWSWPHAGYKAFFNHIDGTMRLMAGRVRVGGFADEVMAMFASAPRNAPCPCGSGKKAKHCHARGAVPATG
jgi:hypothetical protein